MLKGPTGAAWKKIGARKHFGICVPLFGLKTKESCGVGEFLDINPLGMIASPSSTCIPLTLIILQLTSVKRSILR